MCKSYFNFPVYKNIHRFWGILNFQHSIFY